MEKILKNIHLAHYRKKTFTLVEVLIAVSVIMILTLLVYPNVIRARVNANESNAQATLRTISTAAESFASSNNGNYPLSIDNLIGAIPPYLNSNPIGNNQGYTFACGTLSVTAYSCTAQPIVCNTNGNTNYTIATGGNITSVACQ